MNRRSRRLLRVGWILLAVLLCVAIVALPACAPPAEQQEEEEEGEQEEEEEEEEPIKIGILYPLTGYMATVGGHCREGAEFALDQLQADTEAFIDKEIEVVWGDSGSLAATAVDEAAKMVEIDGVCMLLGPLIGDTSMAVGDYMAGAGVPHIKTHPVPFPLTTPDFPWTFGVGGPEAAYSACMARYVYNVLGHDEVVTMTGDWAAGHSFMDSFIGTYEAEGGTVVESVWTTHPVSEFGSYFAALPTADACMAWFDGAEAVAFISQYYAYGVHERMPLEAAFHGSFFPFWALLGANEVEPGCADAVVVGHHAPTTYSTALDVPGNQEFVEGFIAWHPEGLTPDDTQSAAYMGVQVAFEALRATGGDTDPDALANALKGLEIEGPEGPLTIDPESRNSIKDYYIIRVDSIPEFPFYVWTPVYVYNGVSPVPPYAVTSEEPL